MDPVRDTQRSALDLRLPVAVFLAGLVLTIGVAGSRSQGLQRERQLLFGAEAARIQQEVEAAVARQVDDFRSAVHFIAATHPGPQEQYEEFFVAEDPDLPTELPGVILLEDVERERLDALVEREHALGNEGFAVRSFPGSPGPPMIITRTVRPVSFIGLPLRGLDVSMMRNLLIPAALGDEGVALHIAESSQLVSFAGPDAEMSEEFGDVTAVLLARVVAADGRFLGYAVNLDSPDAYLSFLDRRRADDINVELRISGIEETFGRRLSDDAVPYGRAELRDRAEVETASLRWGIEVWANPDFGPANGLLDQGGVLLVGGALSLAAGLAVVLRRRSSHRLRAARFELAHAKTLAATDSLTGLLNRQGLIDSAREIPFDRPAAVFFADLDGFKSVNDENGHDHGDEVLRQVALRLRAIFRKNDLISRIGGDEFVVFATGMDDPVELDRISRRITEEISRIESRISCSLGIAKRSGGEAIDIKELLRAADEAMYSAKRAGGDRFELRN